MGLVVPSSQVVCMGAVEWQGYTVVTPHHLGVCECETVFFSILHLGVCECEFAWVQCECEMGVS